MSKLGSALATRDGKLLGEAGMMTKEKLMLLITSVPCFGEEYAVMCPDRIMGSCGQSVRMDFCAIHHMVDWLIANGVVVREKGEWVDHCVRDWRCSKCGEKIKKVRNVDGYCYDDKPNFCPNCGADMRKGENG